LLFLRGIKLFDFAVYSVTPQMRVVLLFFHSLGLEFFVAGGHISGDRLAFSLGLGAFEGDDFAWHNLFF